MKFLVLPYLVAGATIASYVAANPLRVVVITSEVSPIGHTKASLHTGPIAFIESDSQSHPTSRHRRPCHAGTNLSGKAAQLANAFRKWVGLPAKDEKENTGSHAEVLPLMPIKTFGGVVDGPPQHPDHGEKHHEGHHGKHPDGDHGEKHREGHHGKHHGEHHGKHHGKHHEKHGRPPFWVRVHHALMALGLWEGRAVAFVLGCGIGVLLRMIFVMAVLSYRMIRGEPEHSAYIEIYPDVEDTPTPPPQYVCGADKADLADIKKEKDEDKDEVKNIES